MTLPERTAGSPLAHAAEPGEGPGPGAAGPDTALATQVRQGDVLLVPVAEVPASASVVARSAGRLILAEGEATGHAHAIRSSAAALLEAGGDRYLRVGSLVSLDHEEHAPITVAPGTYRVVIQREYVPAEIAPASFRRVVD